MPAASPVTVNVWGVSQSPVVNVSGPDTVALSVAADVAVTVTSADGCVVNTAVYSAVEPSASDTVSVLNVTPGGLATVTVTVAAEVIR